MQVVAAVRKLNRSEFAERGREMKVRRNAAGRRLLVDVVDRETGEILDELPPEEVLRMMDELEKVREGET
jgi:uncharacterized FlaG/YvyC family protein